MVVKFPPKSFLSNMTVPYSVKVEDFERKGVSLQVKGHLTGEDGVLLDLSDFDWIGSKQKVFTTVGLIGLFLLVTLSALSFANLIASGRFDAWGIFVLIANIGFIVFIGTKIKGHVERLIFGGLVSARERIEILFQSNEEREVFADLPLRKSVVKTIAEGGKGV